MFVADDGIEEYDNLFAFISGKVFGLAASRGGFQPGVNSQVEITASSCQPGVNQNLYLENPDTCPIAAPVHPGSGVMTEDLTDLRVPGPGGLDFSFTRHYSTQVPISDGPLGFGWDDNWDMHISRVNNSAMGKWATGATRTSLLKLLTPLAKCNILTGTRAG